MWRSLVRSALFAALLAGLGAQATPAQPECIAGAKPGGGFDMTCRLAQVGLKQAGLLDTPMRISYLPGGIGAVAFHTMVAQRPAEGGTIVAFSGGSLLNLAIGKFGKYSVDDVKWLAAVGVDHGAVVVRADAPWRTLGELIAALKADPGRIVFGAGTFGSQDWIKAALIARQASVHHKTMRYVAFEGGGSALAALAAGHVQVVPGDVSEVAGHLQLGGIRVLAVLSPQRLPGVMASVPTAREQGHPVEWAVIRGYYLGPRVAQADVDWWQAAFERLLASPQFDALRREQGVLPMALTGAPLLAHVRKDVERYAALARSFGLTAP